MAVTEKVLQYHVEGRIVEAGANRSLPASWDPFDTKAEAEAFMKDQWKDKSIKELTLYSMEGVVDDEEGFIEDEDDDYVFVSQMLRHDHWMYEYGVTGVVPIYQRLGRDAEKFHDLNEAAGTPVLFLMAGVTEHYIDLAAREYYGDGRSYDVDAVIAYVAKYWQPRLRLHDIIVDALAVQTVSKDKGTTQ